jgi:hypothetical protein
LWCPNLSIKNWNNHQVKELQGVSVCIVWFCKRLQFSCQFDVSVDPVGFGEYHTKLKVSVKKQVEIYIVGIMIPFAFKTWLFAEINFMAEAYFLSLFSETHNAIFFM